MNDKQSRIVRILESDARTSPAEIADRLALTEDEVCAAITELEAEGVILGYRALVDWQKLDPNKIFAVIDVKATPEHKQGFDGLAEHISRFPEVHSLYLMSGAYDLSVVLEGNDFRELSRFVSEELAPHPQVQGTTTHFVLKTYKKDGRLVAQEIAVNSRLAVSP